MMEREMAPPGAVVVPEVMVGIRLGNPNGYRFFAHAAFFLLRFKTHQVAGKTKPPPCIRRRLSNSAEKYIRGTSSHIEGRKLSGTQGTLASPSQVASPFKGSFLMLNNN
jgi:hypothetical protein